MICRLGDRFFKLKGQVLFHGLGGSFSIHLISLETFFIRRMMLHGLGGSFSKFLHFNGFFQWLFNSHT